MYPSPSATTSSPPAAVHNIPAAPPPPPHPRPGTMSRYAEASKLENVNGPGDARPTALQIIHDEQREGDFVGKVAVVTGASSGIGPPTIGALLATGATVYGTARDVPKATAAIDALNLSAEARSRAHVVYMDHTKLATVKAAADAIKRASPAINILINSAGVMMVPTRTLTEDGFEVQMGTNHLAHFYLFCQLRDALAAGSTPSFASRVVNVTSAAHRWLDNLDPDDLQLAKPGAYTPQFAYAASKTANIHMANAVDRKYGGRAQGAIHGYTAMPGGIRSPLQRYLENYDAIMEDPVMARFFKSPEQGAATSVFAAVARELEGKGGLYLDNCMVLTKVIPPDHKDVGHARLVSGYAPWAFNPEREDALWQASLKAVGLPEDF
ncbi:NAD(P)-binding domain protein [Niveomyces insectorum RCEF 264]|uniref:NAD(P)-binding domain protein n=1 Tax=Niveomyces insectorum RCEF 264 TaxID=1081102 RepID=A0A167Q7U0_9HYPO|nr:NAD(P)-binding domain protein [Niveomyces insectorum RCEF 264]